MITKVKLDETVRAIIRQRVRTHFGLISEAQTLTQKNIHIELTVTMGDEPDGDIITIKNASSNEMMKSFVMYVPTMTRGGTIGSEVESYVLNYPVEESPENPVLTQGAAWVYQNGSNASFELPVGKPILFSYELVSGEATDPLILQPFQARAASVTQTATPDTSAAPPAVTDPAAGGAAASSSPTEPQATASSVPTSGGGTAGAGGAPTGGSAPADPSSTTPAGGAPADPASTTASREPQQQASTAGMSLQDKIKNVAKAVQRDFADVEKEGVITLQQVSGENAEQGHEWIDVGGAVKYGLSDWASRVGDPYTYFALVNTETKEPVAFVVASDPIDNDHYSTGRFIGPDSKRKNLRTAFCKLYHRATGRVHESCEDGASPGSEDDRPAGSGSKGKGSKGSKGKRESGSDAGGGPGDTRVPADIKQVGGSVTGQGDVKTSKFAGVVPILDPYEKARKGGKKIVTKSMNEHGFKGFPIKKKGKSPRSIAVFFRTSVMLRSGAEPHTTRVSLQELTDDDIVKIKFGFIGPPKGLYWGRGHVVKPGDKDFEAAAAWVFSNPEQFNLLSDNDEDEAEAHAAEDRKAAESGDKRKAATSKSDLTGKTESSINEARRTLSLTPLFDRYRF